MERSRNFYKTIRLGYILISVLIGCIAYNSFYEWQEIEALELDNKKIDEFRKEINNINIQMIKFSLFGETILEWNDKDIEHYHAQRMAMDSMLCRFKATYPAERIDSVRHLLEDKERQMCQIVQILEQQQAINDKITSQVPVIVQKSVQEQPKKSKRKGFLGIFGKKEEAKPTPYQKTANCKKYEAELGWYGLMSRSGKVITPPRYCDITAIGYDLYLCKTDDIRGEVLNGKGVRVR